MKLLMYVVILAVCSICLCGCVTSQSGSAPSSDAEIGFIRVESDTIFSVMYTENLEDLMVIDTNSKGYEYKGVPKDVFDAFIAAEDKDAFYLENIKQKYPETTF